MENDNDLKQWIGCCHTRRCLERSGIGTMEQLSRMSDEDLRSIRGIGPVIAGELNKTIARWRRETSGGRPTVPKTDIAGMKFSKIYPLLVRKAERKGRTKEEVDRVIEWLTGYAPEAWDKDATCRDFFEDAPGINPRADLIRGTVCGVRVEEIEDPLMRNIRRLDKLVDELAGGKPMERILR